MKILNHPNIGKCILFRNKNFKYMSFIMTRTTDMQVQPFDLSVGGHETVPAMHFVIALISLVGSIKYLSN